KAPLPAALAAYARERRLHSRYLGLLSRVLNPFFQSESRVLGWGRDLALPLLCAFPWTRRQMELTMAGLKRGFLDQLFFTGPSCSPAPIVSGGTHDTEPCAPE